jgi:hypothetical protein
MARETKIKANLIASLQIGALLLAASSAFAAPLQVRLQSHVTSQESRQEARAQTQVPASAPHLDLRPPLHAFDADNAGEKPSSAFSSMSRHSNSSREPAELPVLGSEGTRARPTVQEFVQRVHREGLPVARLFETKSALVHLGLSPRGKPGLWLVQKTR